MHRGTSPEEKLLALIRGKRKKTEHHAASDTSHTEEESTASTSWQKRAYAKDIFMAYFSKNRLFEPKTFRVINKFLGVIAIILASYLLLDVFLIKPYKEIPNIVSAQVRDAAADIKQPKREAQRETKDYSKYSSD